MCKENELEALVRNRLVGWASGTPEQPAELGEKLLPRGIRLGLRETPDSAITPLESSLSIPLERPLVLRIPSREQH